MYVYFVVKHAFKYKILVLPVHDARDVDPLQRPVRRQQVAVVHVLDVLSQGVKCQHDRTEQ